MGTIDPSSKLLIWPRRRRRPREDTGFVLGWKETNGHRETVTCAGILTPQPGLEEYQRRIKEWKDRLQEEKAKRCTCLTGSLQIVAVWKATPQTPLRMSSLPKDITVISRHPKGFPWWIPDDKYKNITHKQLVFYEPPSHDNTMAYLQSEFTKEDDVGGATSSWDLMLYRLNHANDLVRLLQNGDSHIWNISGESSEFSEDSGMPADERRTDMVWWSRFLCFLQKNSMVLLHLQRMYLGTDGRLVWFSCFALIRCLAYLPYNEPQLSKRNTEGNLPPCAGSPVFPSRPQKALNHMKRWNRYIAATLDFSFGVGAAFLLFMAWRYSNPHRSLWYHCTAARKRYFEHLANATTWLEDFPAGFKLNEVLTSKMGNGIRHLMQVQRHFLEMSLWNAERGRKFFMPLLMIVSGTCGWTGLLAVLVDLWRLENVHVWLLATVFRYIYQQELFLLSALFRLFRGKKRNVLRQRTDSMQYDAMQLLVGTICFCICVFLWTTLMVYYSFFMLENLLFHLPVVLMWVTYVTCQNTAFGSLAWRLLHPEWFSKSIHMETLSSDADEIQVAKLNVVPESPVKLLLSDLLPHFAAVFKWFVRSIKEILVPSTAKSASCSIPLASWAETLDR